MGKVVDVIFCVKMLLKATCLSVQTECKVTFVVCLCASECMVLDLVLLTVLFFCILSRVHCCVVKGGRLALIYETVANWSDVIHYWWTKHKVRLTVVSGILSPGFPLAWKVGEGGLWNFTERRGKISEKVIALTSCTYFSHVFLQYDNVKCTWYVSMVQFS